MDYDCPACNEKQSLDPLRQEYEDGFVFILWGKCGHRIHLDPPEDIEKSIEKTRKENSGRFFNNRTF